MRQCPKCSEDVKGKAAFCPSCGEKLGRKSTNEKKSRLTESKKGSKAPFLAIGALVVLGGAALAAYGLFRPVPSQVTAGSSSSSSSSAAADTVSFDVSTFDDGLPKYYSYKGTGGKLIKFFVLKSSDGVIRAAFDACDVCYQSKKGYRQDGDFMVCNNCGQRFTSVRINEVKGGCNPAPLERKIEGTKLVIAVSDILTGARYF